MRNCLLAVLLAAGPFIPGCGCTDWLAYVFAPASPKQTVNPDPGIPSLKKKTIAVVVFAAPEILLDYGTVQLELSDAISTELGRRISHVRTIDPRTIVRYQDENPAWDSVPPGKLCRALNTDYVLLVSVTDFSTREPGSLHLARGRLDAEASLYAESPPASAANEYLWRAESIRVVYPEQAPVGIAARDDFMTRANTMRAFAEKLTKRFYKHKVPKGP